MGDMHANFGMVDWICAERGELHIDDIMMLTDEQFKEYNDKQDAYDAQTKQEEK